MNGPDAADILLWHKDTTSLLALSLDRAEKFRIASKLTQLVDSRLFVALGSFIIIFTPPMCNIQHSYKYIRI